MSNNLTPLSVDPSLTSVNLTPKTMRFPADFDSVTISAPSPRGRVTSLNDDLSGMFRGRSINDELNALGLNIDDKIFTVSNNGNVGADFIRVTGPSGTSLIQLDTPAYIEATPEDGLEALFVTRPRDSVGIPHTFKDPSWYEIDDGRIDGISYICENGVCIVDRLGNTTPYLKANQEAFENPSLGRVYSVIPVTKYSNLKKDPKNIGCVKQSNEKIRKRLTDSSTKSTARTNEEIRNLNNTFNQIQQKQANTIKSLNSDISKLDQYDAIYRSKPNLTPEEANKFRVLQTTLEVKNRELSRTLMVSSELERVGAQIAQINANLRALLL